MEPATGAVGLESGLLVGIDLVSTVVDPAVVGATNGALDFVHHEVDRRTNVFGFGAGNVSTFSRRLDCDFGDLPELFLS